ncbi:MAG TPA: NADH-quinone oxidoreductase subunit C [Pyrinomonadaceae bacterium]|nr:NADH-quinone oxidoreductase subunit C [Pyrinomonadaceae bacterium]
MPEDTKQPDPTEPPKPDAPESDASGVQSAALSGSDAEKSAIVEEAKNRVAAAKESLAAKAETPAGTPKPPVKKKEEGPKPTDAGNHPLVQKLRAKFGESVGDASEFIGQLSVNIRREKIVQVCEFLRQDEETPFAYLSDLTCVHFPDRKDAPFEIVYNLYSIEANERIRLKVATTEQMGVYSVTGVWPAANWLEREVFDLFGVRFANHPDLRRLLLPPDWEGYPLRKDFPLEFVENAWTEEHLPEMTDVQREQLEQRRAYGLEILSVPQERMMREIFRGGKDVMPKDK